LVPGEVGRIVIIAADRKQARTIFGYCLGFLENIPLLKDAGMIVRRTQDTLDLANGITIEIQAASFRTIRGYSLVACLADEVAFWMTDEDSSNPDIEIIRSVRPALASIRGSMLLVASSPYAEAGLYLHSLPLLTSGRVRLPDVAGIVPEFCSLERRVGSEGRDKVDARGGKPEDVAKAVAGCIWMLSGPRSAAES
jgi:hypothetical protein